MILVKVIVVLEATASRKCIKILMWTSTEYLNEGLEQ